MLVTVFTPSHRPDHLDDCHRSLLAQTHGDWEWIVLLNGGATWQPPDADPRIRIVQGSGPGLVGAQKREACALATGEILLELDHDDVLLPDCLAEVVDAFDAHPEASLVYSDFAQINEDGSPNHDRFNAANGWTYEPFEHDGVTYNRCLSMEPTPNNVSYIWYAPNHVRAFRLSDYEEIGGYDASLEVLDDQDLMMKLFRIGSFHRIPKCLYLQRMHARNTQRDSRINAFIQSDTVERYWGGIADMAIAWANRAGLSQLDLATPNSVGRRTPGTERVVLNPAIPTLQNASGSVGVIFATDVLQLIDNTERFFSECYRVLAPGGLLITLTPSTDGRGAFQDPTHRTFWNQNSFWYVTQTALRDRAYPMNRDVRFQVSGIRTFFPGQFERANDIPYVAANLIAVKDGPRNGGPLLC